MYTTNTISYQFPKAKTAFFLFHIRGRITSLWNKLTGNRPCLEDFSIQAFRLSAGRKHLGVMNISVAEITGSVTRSRDFDPQFRPLKTTLRDHWVSAFVQTISNEKQFVVIYKVGEKYFVKEGNNWVSVAKYLGKQSIQADVWEFSYTDSQAELLQPVVFPINQKMTAAI